jgi:hypothetical protein
MLPPPPPPTPHRNPAAKAPSGNAATCITLTPDGGVNFFCRECARSGYRPFDGAKALSFWIRNGNGGSAADLRLKMFIRGQKNNYCGSEPRLSGLSPAQTSGDWSKFVIPLTGGGFQCSSPGDMTHVEWHSVGGQGTEEKFCLGDVEIVR